MSKFSPKLALAGIGAALVAIWGLLGGPDIPSSGSMRWIVLGVTVAIGIALIFSGGRGKRSEAKPGNSSSPER